MWISRGYTHDPSLLNLPLPVENFKRCLKWLSMWKNWGWGFELIFIKWWNRRSPQSTLYKTKWYSTMMEKAMATHSSTLAWKLPRTEEPGRLQSMGSLESDTTERLHFHFSLLCIGEGNGNPLQCSCLENPRDGEAWWATVYGVAQSRTRLKRLSSSSSIVLWYKPSVFKNSLHV